MEFLIAAHSDIGIKKNTNQDSLLIKAAQTSLGKVCLCVMCDGMGGLAKGEMASASVVRVFEKWFENELPNLIDKGFRVEDMKLDWDNIVLEMNDKLCAYANDLHVRMGTTLAALIIFEDHYYIMNIGDSRVYMLTDQLYQLTEDQTLMQSEIKLGHMTPEQAAVHPQRNVLLQCVGASEVVNPDFFDGPVYTGCEFLLCSDGFRHIISPEEIYYYLNPADMNSEQLMQERLVMLTELNKQRRETDNITSMLIKIV